MDGVVMCGGRGTRLEAETEKPLLEINGRPMVERVLAALQASQIERVHAAVSPNAPETRTYVEGTPASLIETPGEGYVEDLKYVLERVGQPVLTVAADLPLLSADVVTRVRDAHGGGSLAVCTPVTIKELLDLSVGHTVQKDGRELAPTGVNVVGEGEETTHVTYDIRLAVNVNRRSDVDIAEVLA